MKVKSKNKTPKKSLKNYLSLKRAPTSNYNFEIFNRHNTKIDLEKAHYEAELLLKEDDSLLKEEFMFQRISVNIFQFFVIYLNLLIGFI